jgi:ubiquinone/menaquinone biosynthesis C-methylase UbiE
MPTPTTSKTDADKAKDAAIEQWSADPCGGVLAEGDPGTRTYFENLEASRVEYAAWMEPVLGYAECAGKKVLDVGCGQGIDLVRYARSGADANGIDLTPRHVELANSHLEALGLEGKAIVGDAEDMPFEDATFDRVSSNGVLHHTPGIEAAVREVNRVLKPGGEFRMIVYNKSSLHYWMNQFLYQGLMKGGLRREGSMEGVMSAGVEYTSVEARPLVRVYTPRQARAILKRAGFRDVRSIVRQFKPGDAFLYGNLAQRIDGLNSQKALDRVGNRAGWYVIASGTR